MGTYNIRQYRSIVRRRIKSIRKLQDTIPAKASMELRERARLNAPRDSGKLTKSIVRSKLRKGQFSVRAGYFGDFRFNVGRFTNQEFMVNYKKRANRWFRSPQKVQYGQSATSSGGNPIRWTALRNPWWDSAVRSVARTYGKNALKDIRAVLRG